VEQFNTERTAKWGKNRQLVQCWLTKFDTAQQMGRINCTDLSVNIGRKKINIISKQTEYVADVTSNSSMLP
jgi:hypothetical protein